MAKIISYKTHTSGVPLGGIGSGSVELLPDGDFHYWQIYDPPRRIERCHDSKVDDGEGSTGALSFWIRMKEPGCGPVVRKLSMSTHAEDFTYRMFAWNKPVEQINYEGRFPVCDLEYGDPRLPGIVSARAIAPFVPHDEDVSATPGFCMDFTLENPTDKPLEISLLGRLTPDFLENSTNTLFSHGEAKGIFLRGPKPSDAPGAGNLCLSLDGNCEKSYITADYTRFLKEYVGNSEFGVTQESALFAFRERGFLPCTQAGEHPLLVPEDVSALTDEALDELYESHIRFPYARSLHSRISHMHPGFPKNRGDRERFLAACRKQIGRMKNTFGGCALCAGMELAPGECRTVRFILTWYFPNHYCEGKRLGHYYENLYSDAREANIYLLNKEHQVFEKAEAFADLLYSTSLPEAYPDAWSGNLSSLVKSSWFLKDGKFGLWEGLGYCGFHTTDITYHASFGLLTLFPELQKRQMRMGAAFQRADGRVHHLFTPDLDHVDDSFDRVDMNMQFVLMVLRDYLYTGDRSYLEDLWPNVCAAMDSIVLLDSDGDGLPDRGTRRNTYDSWNFSGSPAYISVLWLAALKAAVHISRRLGSAEREAQWAALLELGKTSLERRLWNGEYYNLWADETCCDESLMTDQLDGEWFLRMIGLEGNIPEERVRSVLQKIFDHNFDEEAGLINAACPEGRETTLHTYRNCQAGAVWTGIGYLFGALAMSVGKREMADSVVNVIYENQNRLGALWDHWECGHHYTRPMSSWSTMIAAIGMKIDAQKREITLSPVGADLRAPLCVPQALAEAAFCSGDCTLRVVQGSFDGWKIMLASGGKVIVK